MKVPAEIIYGDLPFVVRRSRKYGQNGELDALTLSILSEIGGWEEEIRGLGYVHHEKVAGFHALFVESIALEDDSSLVGEITVECVGLFNPGEKRRRVLGVNGQQVSVGPFERVVLVWVKNEEGEKPPVNPNSTPIKQDRVLRRIPAVDETTGEVEYKVIATPSGNGTHWNVRVASVTVTDTYFVTVPPDMTVVGTRVEPLNAPAIPGDPWSGYDQPMRGQHPNGWVLDDRSVDEIYAGKAGGLWAVTDSFGYYYPAIPA